MVPDRAVIESQLEKVLKSKAFAKAPRLKQFLQFVVGEWFNGGEGNLKEATIGILLFGREAGYDSTKDALVRTTASRVRQKLQIYYQTEGESDAWFIEIPADGYVPRFTLRTGQPSPATDIRTEESFPARASEDFTDSPTEAKALWQLLKRAKVGAAILFATLALATTLILAWPTLNRDSTVMAFSQLTNDGLPKDGLLFTDGSTVYFTERLHGHPVAVSVPVTGGAVKPLDLPLPEPILFDMAPGHRFLVSAVGALWEWSPGASPRRLADHDVNAASWLSDSGWAEAFPTQDQLRLHTQNSQRLISLPDRISDLAWSAADEVLRFTVTTLRTENSGIWEIRGLNATPRLIPSYPPGATHGAWTPDGKLFVFLAKSDAGLDIWTAREGFQRKRLAPVRLTHGPLDYRAAVPTPDGRCILAIGHQEREELMRYDAAVKEFVPFLGGIRAVEVDFSRDRRWIAYISFPQRTLWKAKADGSDALQLTYPPVKAIEPHWSPDGSSLAFMGQLPDGRRRVYIIPVEGGPPKEAASFDTGDQGVPTWSPDGTRIVWGELLYRKPHAEMAVHVLDLKRATLEEVPGSKGVWTPRWSPDGRYIVGTTPDSHALRLLDWRTGEWQQLADFRHIEYPAWTADSSSFYFFGIGPTIYDRAIYRMSVHKMKLERVVNLGNLQPPTAFQWYGITPEGSPLALRGLQITELYALHLTR